MNVELALAALEDAKANPGRFNMHSFWGTLEDFTKDAQDMTVPPCGTTGCFAGFASLRAAPVGTRIMIGDFFDPSRIVHPGQDPAGAPDTEAYAIDALDITEDQASTLFYLDSIGEVEVAVRYLIDSPDTDGETLWELATAEFAG